MKFVLILIGVLIAVAWIKSRWQSPKQRVQRPEQPPQIAMVRCEQCGVHLPQGDAVGTQGRWYCSAAHQQAHGNR